MNAPRVSVVVLTYNRCDEVLRTVAGLLALPDPAPVIVVDNGSTDDTVARMRAACPTVQVVEVGANLGAAGRNAGVAAARTPYVAFCDDDTCWSPGALTHAADILDAHPDIGVLVARILVGAERREDPTSTAMARSPLGAVGPGRRLLGFMAGASVMRVRAFQQAGGYEPRFFLGGEEALLAFDLAALGWQMVYTDAIATTHVPSRARDASGRRRLLLRNALWVAWMRLPWRLAFGETLRLLRAVRDEPALWRAVVEAVSGLPWALSRRRVLPRQVTDMWRVLHLNKG